MSFKDLNGLVDFASEGVGGFEEVEEFSVIHFQKHTGDLTSEFGLGGVDEGVEALSDHVLLHLRTGGGEGGGGKGLALLGDLLNRLSLHGCVSDVLLEVEVLLSLYCVERGVGEEGGRRRG